MALKSRLVPWCLYFGKSYRQEYELHICHENCWKVTDNNMVKVVHFFNECGIWLWKNISFITSNSRTGMKEIDSKVCIVAFYRLTYILDIYMYMYINHFLYYSVINVKKIS